MQPLAILLGLTALVTAGLYVWGFVLPVEPQSPPARVVAQPATAPAPVAPPSSPAGAPPPVPVQAAAPPVQAERPAEAEAADAPAPVMTSRPTPMPKIPDFPPNMRSTAHAPAPDPAPDEAIDDPAMEQPEDLGVGNEPMDPTELNRQIMEEYQAELDRQAEMQQMEYERLNAGAMPDQEEVTEPEPPEPEPPEPIPGSGAEPRD